MTAYCVTAVSQSNVIASEAMQSSSEEEAKQSL